MMSKIFDGKNLLCTIIFMELSLLTKQIFILKLLFFELVNSFRETAAFLCYPGDISVPYDLIFFLKVFCASFAWETKIFRFYGNIDTS